ncbi:hypothetical protein V5J37_000774 [Endozoicomonas sp. NE43]
MSTFIVERDVEISHEPLGFLLEVHYKLQHST